MYADYTEAYLHGLAATSSSMIERILEATDSFRRLI